MKSFAAWWLSLAAWSLASAPLWAQPPQTRPPAPRTAAPVGAPRTAPAAVAAPRTAPAAVAAPRTAPMPAAALPSRAQREDALRAATAKRAEMRKKFDEAIAGYQARTITFDDFMEAFGAWDEAEQTYTACVLSVVLRDEDLLALEQPASAETRVAETPAAPKPPQSTAFPPRGPQR